jgi:hypothetical protein
VVGCTGLFLIVKNDSIDLKILFCIRFPLLKGARGISSSSGAKSLSVLDFGVGGDPPKSPFKRGTKTSSGSSFSVPNPVPAPAPPFEVGWQGGFIHQKKNLSVHFSELSLLARNSFQGD